MAELDPLTGLPKTTGSLPKAKDIEIPGYDAPVRSSGFTQEKGFTYDYDERENRRIAARQQSGLQQAGRALSRGIGGGVLTALDATFNMFDAIDAEERSALGEWIDQTRETLDENTQIYREELDSPWSWESGTAWEMVANVLDSGIGFAVPGLIGGAGVSFATKAARYANILRLSERTTGIVNTLGAAVIGNQAESRVMATQTYQETKQRLMTLVNMGQLTEEQARLKAAEAANDMYLANRAFIATNYFQLGKLFKGVGSIDNIIKPTTFKSFVTDRLKEGLSEMGEELSQGIISRNLTDIAYGEAGGKIEQDALKRNFDYLKDENLLYETALGFFGGIVEIGAIKAGISKLNQGDIYNDPYVKRQQALLSELESRMNTIMSVSETRDQLKEKVNSVEDLAIIESNEIAQLAYDTLYTGTFGQVNRSLDEMIEKGGESSEKAKRIKQELSRYASMYQKASRYENTDEVFANLSYQERNRAFKKHNTEKINRIKKEYDSIKANNEISKKQDDIIETAMFDYEGETGKAEKIKAINTLANSEDPILSDLGKALQVQEGLEQAFVEYTNTYKELISSETQNKVVKERQQKQKEIERNEKVVNNLEQAAKQQINKEKTIETAKESSPTTRKSDVPTNTNITEEEGLEEEGLIASNKVDAVLVSEQKPVPGLSESDEDIKKALNLDDSRPDVSMVPADVEEQARLAEKSEFDEVESSEISEQFNKPAKQDTPVQTPEVESSIPAKAPAPTPAQPLTYKVKPIKEKNSPVTTVEKVRNWTRSVAFFKTNDSTIDINNPSYFQNIEEVTLELEPDNEYDPNAIAVYHGTDKIGYVRSNESVGEEINFLIESGKLSVEEGMKLLDEHEQYRQNLIQQLDNGQTVTFNVNHQPSYYGLNVYKSQDRNANAKRRISDIYNLIPESIIPFVHYVNNKKKILSPSGKEFTDIEALGLRPEELISGRVLLIIPVKDKNGQILYYNRLDLQNDSLFDLEVYGSSRNNSTVSDFVKALKKETVNLIKEYYSAKRQNLPKWKELGDRLQEHLNNYFVSVTNTKKINTLEDFQDYLLTLNRTEPEVFYFFQGGDLYFLELKQENGKNVVVPISNSQGEFFYANKKDNKLLLNLSSNLNENHIERLLSLAAFDTFINSVFSKIRINMSKDLMNQTITLNGKEFDYNEIFTHIAESRIELDNVEKKPIQNASIEYQHQIVLDEQIQTDDVDLPFEPDDVVTNEVTDEIDLTALEVGDEIRFTHKKEIKTGVIEKVTEKKYKIAGTDIYINKTAVIELTSKPIVEEKTSSKRSFEEIQSELNNIFDEIDLDNVDFSPVVDETTDEPVNPSFDLEGLFENRFLLPGIDPDLQHRMVDFYLKQYVKYLKKHNRLNSKDKKQISTDLKIFIEDVSNLLLEKIEKIYDDAPSDVQEAFDEDTVAIATVLENVEQFYNILLLESERTGLNITFKNTKLAQELYQEDSEEFESDSQVDDSDDSDDDLGDETKENNWDDDAAAQVDIQRTMLQELKVLFDSIKDPNNKSKRGTFYDRSLDPDYVYRTVMLLVADRNPYGTYTDYIRILKEEAVFLPWLNQFIKELESQPQHVKYAFASTVNTHYATSYYLAYNTPTKKNPDGSWSKGPLETYIRESSGNTVEQLLLDSWRSRYASNPFVRLVDDEHYTIYVERTPEQQAYYEELHKKAKILRFYVDELRTKRKEVLNRFPLGVENELYKKAEFAYQKTVIKIAELSNELFDVFGIDTLPMDNFESMIVRTDRGKVYVNKEPYDFSDLMSGVAEHFVTQTLAMYNTSIEKDDEEYQKRINKQRTLRTLYNQSEDIALAKAMAPFNKRALSASFIAGGKSVYQIEIPRYIHEIFNMVIIRDDDPEELIAKKKSQLVKIKNDLFATQSYWLNDIFLVDETTGQVIVEDDGTPKLNPNSVLKRYKQGKVSIASFKNMFGQFRTRSGFDDLDDSNREFLAINFFNNMELTKNNVHMTWFIDPAFSDKKEAHLHYTKVSVNNVEYDVVKNEETKKPIGLENFRLHENAKQLLSENLVYNDLAQMLQTMDENEQAKRTLVGYKELVDGKHFFGLPILNDEDNPLVAEFLDLVFNQTREHVSFINQNGLTAQRLELSDEAQQILDNILDEYVAQLVDEKLAEWKKFNVVYNGQIGYKKNSFLQSHTVNSTVTDDTIRAFAYDYIVNYTLFHSNFQQVFVGAPQTFGKFTSDGNQKVLKKNKFDTIENVISNMTKRFAGLFGPKIKLGDSLRNPDGSIKDIHTLFLEDKVLDISEYGGFFKELVKMHNAYGEITQTDAQEFYSVAHYVEVAHHLGQLTKEEYDYFMEKVNTKEFKQGKPVFTNEDILKLSQPIKPMLYGEHKDVRGGIYIKSSAIPLIPQMIASTKMKQLFDAMERSGADRIAFVSAVKQGLIENKVLTYDILNDKKVSLNEYVVDIPAINMGIQQAVPFKDSAMIRSGSQERLLLYAGLPADTVIDGMTGEEHKGLFNRTYKQVYDAAWQQFLFEVADIDEENLQIQTNEAGQYIINHKKVYEILLNQAIDLGFSIREIESLFTSKSGSFEIPLMYSSASTRIQNLMVSLINNRVFKHKSTGESGVLVTDAFIEQLDSDIGDAIVRLEGHSGPLLGQRIELDENGNEIVKPAQIIVPFRFKDRFGKSISIKSITKIVDGKRYIDTDAIDPELLQSFGYRIPTQAHNSMAAFEIVGFLPESYGNLVITAPTIITQMGSDFDVDKLYRYMYNADIVNDKLVRYHNESIEKAIDEPSKENEYRKEFVEAFLADNKKRYEEYQALTEKQKKKIPKISLATTKDALEVYFNEKKKLLQDRLLEYRLQVVSNPSVFKERVSKPNSFGKLTELVKEFSKTDLNRSKPWFYSYTSQQYQSYRYSSGRAGKVGTGSFSMDAVFLPVIEGTDFDIPLLSDFMLADSKGTPVSSAFDARGQYKIDNNSYFQSASVDNAKENILDVLGIIPEAFDIIRSMIIDGHAEDTIIYLIKNPYIEQALREFAASKAERAEFKNYDDIVNTIYRKLYLQHGMESGELVADEKGIVSNDKLSEYINKLNASIKLETQNLTIKDLGSIAKGEYQSPILKLLNAELLQQSISLKKRGAMFRRIQRAFNNDSAMIKKTLYAGKARVKELEEIRELIGDNAFNILADTNGIKGLAAQYVNRGVNFWNQYVNVNQIDQIASQIEQSIRLKGEYNEYTHKNLMAGIAKGLRALAYSDVPIITGSNETAQEMRKRMFFAGKQLNENKEPINPSLAQVIDRVRKVYPNNKFLNALELSMRSTFHSVKFPASARSGINEMSFISAIETMLNDNTTDLGTFWGVTYTPRKLAIDLYRYQLLLGGIEGPIQFLKYFPYSLDKMAGTIEHLRSFNDKIFKGEVLLDRVIEQIIQNNPKLLRKASEMGGLSYFQDEKTVFITSSTSYYTETSEGEIIPIKYLAVYDQRYSQKYRIYRFDSVVETSKESSGKKTELRYVQIPSLGTSNFYEMDLQYVTGKESAQSVFDTNNKFGTTDGYVEDATTRTQFEKEYLSGGIDGLLKRLTLSNNELIRNAALQLDSKAIKDVKVVVSSKYKNFAYNSNDNTIYIPTAILKEDLKKGNIDKIENTLLEEIIHASTITVLRNPGAYGQDAVSIVKDLNYIGELVRAEILKRADVKALFGNEEIKSTTLADVVKSVRNKVQNGKKLTLPEFLVYRTMTLSNTTVVTNTAELLTSVLRTDNENDAELRKVLESINLDTYKKRLSEYYTSGSWLKTIKNMIKELLKFIGVNFNKNNALAYVTASVFNLNEQQAAGKEDHSKAQDKAQDKALSKPIVEAKPMIPGLFKAGTVEKDADVMNQSKPQTPVNIPGFEMSDGPDDYSPVQYNYSNTKTMLDKLIRKALNKKGKAPIEVRGYVKKNPETGKEEYVNNVDAYHTFIRPWNKMSMEVYKEPLFTLTEGGFVTINDKIANLLDNAEWFIGNSSDRPSSQQQRMTDHLKNPIC